MGVFSDCMYALTCDLCPCGKETRLLVHFRLNVSASRNTTARMENVAVMLADKVQICINRSGQQHICLFLLILSTAKKHLAWWAVNLNCSATLTRIVPSSSKWISINICCIYANIKHIVSCFFSVCGQRDVFDVEETHDMLPVVRIILPLFSCARLCDCVVSTRPQEFLSGIKCIPKRWMQTNLPLSADQFLHRLTPLP